MNHGLILAIVLVLYFFPDYTKHILLLVVILAFRNKASLNAREAVPWIEGYDALVEWMNAHGGAWPRQMHHSDRRGSGMMSEADREEHRHALWVQKQRVRDGQARLSVQIEAREGVNRAELLERLEGWSWRKVQHVVQPWIDRYNALVAWMDAHGGAWPRDLNRLGRISSMSEADAEEHRHALWVHKQRRAGKTLLLRKKSGDTSRADLLESLPGWSWGEYKQESWIDRYNAVVAWRSAHGGVMPRRRGWQGRISSMSEADAEETRLASWVQHQRGERSKGRMQQEIERTSEGDISRVELFKRLLRPQPAPISRPIDLSVEPLSYSPEPQRPEPLFFPPEPQPLGAIDLSVDAIEKEDRMKRRRVEEQRGR